MVATDTLATSLDGRPYKFTTKAFILPHLNMIIAGTGSGGFLERWFVRINVGMIVRGIDNLNHHAPGDLAAIWQRYKEEFSIKDITTTVYHFGFSEVENVIHSYAYRSTDHFQSVALRYGLAVKPVCEVPENYRAPDDFRKMMDDQRRKQAALPENERVYIGGEIEVHHLTRLGFHVVTIDRFDDYAQDEEAIYRNFAEER